MLIDSHTHAWDYWPYEPPVPDPESRGRVEQLLWEMDRHGVDRAVLVCARIEHNPENNDYAAECVRRAGLSPGQLDAIYLTGGSSALKQIQQALRRNFPGVPMVEVDMFGGVASGNDYAGMRA